MTEPFAGFEVGTRYHLQKQMRPASSGYGTYFGGIQPKGRYPRTEGVIVLAVLGEGTRYGNRWDGDTLVYSGEDVRGRGANASGINQSPEVGANRVLTHSKELGIPVYCFWANTDEPDWEYLGLGEVESWSLEQRGARKVVEYRMGFLGAASSAQAEEALRSAETEVDDDENLSLTSKEPRTTARVNRKVRRTAFSKSVREAYSFRCAFCGAARKDAAGRPEVDAAHIFPVEKEGPDKLRNGVALCKFHHWALDGALVGIDTTLTMRVLAAGKTVSGLSDLDGRPLAVLPLNEKRRPHTMFLEARWELSVAGWTRDTKDQGSG